MLLGLIGLIIILIVGMFLLSIYKKCSNNELLIKYGLGGNKIIDSKGTFIIPILQGYKRMSLQPINIDIILDRNSNVVSNDKIRVVVEADATFAVSSDPNERVIASSRLLNFDEKGIAELAQEILTGQTRTIISEMSFEELLQDRAMLMQKVSENAEKELSKLGLDLINFNIKMINDLDNIVNMLGQKASAIATTDAEISVAEQRKVSEINVATKNTEKEIKVAEQRKAKEISIAQTNAEIIEETTKAELRKEKTLAERDAEKIRYSSESFEKQEIYKIDTDNKIKLQSINKQKEVQLEAEKTKQIIASETRKTVELEANVKLEERRAVEIVETKVSNEKKEIEIETQLNIKKKEAENQLEIAKTKADAIRIEAEAEANKIKLLAEARAVELARPIEEKAKAEQKLLDVYGQNGMVTLKLLEILPELAKAQALALSNIKVDSLHIIGGENGGSNAGNQIGGLATDIIKSIPAFKMANDIAKGLNIPSINILGEKEVESNIAHDSFEYEKVDN